MSLQVFKDIIETRWWCDIDHKIDDAIASDETSPEHRVMLDSMYTMTSRAEIYALAHDALGQHDKAAELREFVAKRQRSQ